MSLQFWNSHKYLLVSMLWNGAALTITGITTRVATHCEILFCLLKLQSQCFYKTTFVQRGCFSFAIYFFFSRKQIPHTYTRHYLHCVIPTKSKSSVNENPLIRIDSTSQSDPMKIPYSTFFSVRRR